MISKAIKPNTFKGKIELSTTIILESSLCLWCVNRVCIPLSYLVIYARNHIVFQKQVWSLNSTHVYHIWEQKSLPTCKFSMHTLNFSPNVQFTNHSVSPSRNELEKPQLESNKGCIFASKTPLINSMDNTEPKIKQKIFSQHWEEKVK